MRSVIALIAIILAGMQVDDPLIDITRVSPRNRAREPMTSSASGGAVGGNGPVAQRGVSVGLTILSLKSFDAPEPSLVFEVRLTNIGRESLEFPSDPNLADFEPESANTPYAYISADLYILLNVNQQSSAVLPGVLLYGSKQVTGTLKLLGPGQSVRIRATTRLKALNADGVPKVTANLRAKVGLMLQQCSVMQNKGALHEDSMQIPIQTVTHSMNVSS